MIWVTNATITKLLMIFLVPCALIVYDTGKRTTFLTRKNLPFFGLFGLRLRSTGGGSRSGFEGEGSSVLPLVSRETGRVEGLMGM